MKSIQLPAIITSLRAKVDGSLGLSLVTPELSNEAKLAFFQLQNKNIDITVVPLDYEDAPIVKVDKELGQKTQGQRIRAVLFILYQQMKREISFEEYYKIRTEQFIDQLKGEIE